LAVSLSNLATSACQYKNQEYDFTCGTLDLTKQNWRLVNWVEGPGTKIPDPENDGYIKGCNTKGGPCK
jgi:hypothetical protein